MTQDKTEPKQQVAEDKPTYADKTKRIQAWIDLVKSVTPYIWLVVILIVIVPLIGRAFITGSVPENSEENTLKNAPVVVIDRQIPNQNEIDRAIASAITDARTDAEKFASEQLDEWVDELMTRVDNSFLPWYFDYFNQKKMEFSAPFVWLSRAVAHSIDSNKTLPSVAVAEKLTADFQTEFAKRVLRPKIAQLELERITKNTINLYVSELEKNINSVQSSYNIPQGQWERYLDDIAITIRDTEGNISNLSMKVLAAGTTYVFAKAMIPVVTKIGSKVAVSFAGKAGAKMAAKTGGAVAGKLGAQFLDPIVGVGIIIWDVWDYDRTVNIEKPVLRDAILDYLTEVKASLLDNHQDSITAAIYEVEGGILNSLKLSNRHS